MMSKEIKKDYAKRQNNKKRKKVLERMTLLPTWKILGTSIFTLHTHQNEKKRWNKTNFQNVSTVKHLNCQMRGRYRKISPKTKPKNRTGT